MRRSTLARRLAVLAVASTAFGVSELADAYCAGGGGAPEDVEAITVTLLGGELGCGQLSGPGPQACPDRNGVTVEVTATCWSSASISFDAGGVVAMNRVGGGGSFEVVVGAYTTGGAPITGPITLDPTGQTPTTFVVYPDTAQDLLATTAEGAYEGTATVIVSGNL